MFEIKCIGEASAGDGFMFPISFDNIGTLPLLFYHTQSSSSIVMMSFSSFKLMSLSPFWQNMKSVSLLPGIFVKLTIPTEINTIQVIVHEMYCAHKKEDSG